MKKILLAGACVLAMSATAMAQSSTTDGSSTMHKNSNTMMKKNTMKPDPNAATTGSSMDSKRGVPGNNTAGGDASQSNPKSTAPGAAKAGGG
jgi:hypothetical protein